MPAVDERKEGVAEICSGQYRPIGFVVRFRNGRFVGVVEDVIDLEYVCQLWVAYELSIPLLRHNAREAGQFETVIETHTVHHRIPLVPEYIQDVDRGAKSITVKLPAGFIRLGREELYIRVLKRELKPYIAHLPNKFREKVRGERELPRYNDLREQGRLDLVSLMKLAGGPAQVAQTLGCKTAFRPRGYFQDLDNLDWDLSCFVASGWVKLPTSLDPLLTSQAEVGTPPAAPKPNATAMPVTSPGKDPTAQSASTPVDASGRNAFSIAIASEAEVTPAAGFPTNQQRASTTAQADVMLSLDCGDELLEDEDRELCEIDNMATCASEEYMYMTTITHAGKLEHGGMDSSIALQAGYDAPDDRYATDFPAAGSPAAPGTAADAEQDSRDGADSSMDEEYFYGDGEDSIDSDEDEWVEIGDDIEADEAEIRDSNDVGSANNLVGEWYYYNTITQQVSLEEPQVPSVHRVGQALVRVEDEAQRYMPSQASLEEAGRNNLINAIRLHGGFQVVADILQRERLFTRRPAVTDRGVILRKVRRVQQTLGLPPDEFPTREQFEACQMPHVVGWITTAGGFRKVAMELGMRTRRMMSQITVEEVAQELRGFMQQREPPPGEEWMSANGDRSHRWHYLPSLQHLRQAGYKDLALKLQRSDTKEIAGLLGVEARKRGWPKGRPRKKILHSTKETGGKAARPVVRPAAVATALQARNGTISAMRRLSMLSARFRSGAGMRLLR